MDSGIGLGWCRVLPTAQADYISNYDKAFNKSHGINLIDK